MDKSIAGAFTSSWWLIVLCGCFLWWDYFQEKKERKREGKKLNLPSRAQQHALLGVYIVASVCRLPLPQLARLSIWCWGIVLVTGLFSFWISILHVRQAVCSSALMTPEEFVEKAIAWTPIKWKNNERHLTIYSRLLYNAGLSGILITFWGCAGLLFELWQPIAISQGIIILLLLFVGMILVLTIIPRLLIPSWERQAELERKRHAT